MKEGRSVSATVEYCHGRFGSESLPPRQIAAKVVCDGPEDENPWDDYDEYPYDDSW
jgi:hypothetical protein